MFGFPMLTIDNSGGVPHFFHRSAVFSKLFDFIIECRLAENSAAIAEHIKRVCLPQSRPACMLY